MQHPPPTLRLWWGLIRQKKRESKEVILAYLAGKMRMNRIRVLVGDKVELEQDQYGGKARVTRRF